MNKLELIKEVSRSTGLQENKVETILNEIFSELVYQLYSNKIVTIQGFGTFELKQKEGIELKENFNQLDDSQKYEIIFNADKKFLSND